MMIIASAVPASMADQKLPDLIMWARQSGTSSQCYLYCGSISTTTAPNKVVWRFNATTANIGTGALEIRDVTHPNATQDIYQRIFDTEGGSTEELIATIPDTYSIAGRHLFLTGFSLYNLRAVLPDDGVGPVVATHEKTSSGIVDSVKYSPAIPGAPLSSHYTNVNNPAIPMGISVGYADIYQSSYPNQWIDVTALTAGQYWLEVITDPYNRIRESDETNNTTRVLVTLPAIPAPQNQPGDYDLDDDVDAADYVMWRNTVGQLVSAGTGADGDADGRVWGPDFDVWRAHFGVVSASGTGSSENAAVPEPATALLLMFSAASLCLRRRRSE